VFGGLTRLVVAALLAGAFLVAPSAAFACGGGPSAQNVYSPCVPTGGGGKPASGTPAGKASGKGSSVSVPISAPAARAIKRAGKDRHLLRAIVRGYGNQRRLAPDAMTGAAASPTALGSAFDLGSGPTALIIVLGGMAVLLLTGSGMRVWRSRHRA
jgi:hypothetical protein